MFADTALAAQIEIGEALLTRDIVLGALEAGKAPDAFETEIAGGVAGFVRPGSPMNKVIGLGFQDSVESAAWPELEKRYHARGEPVRVELSTLCPGGAGHFLTERGFRLIGFENVLGNPLSESPLAESTPIRTLRVGDAELAPGV